MKEELQFAPLPEDYDDDRRDLNILSTIQNALNDDLAFCDKESEKAIQATRHEWQDLLWPSFVEAEATTLEALRDVHAQAQLIKSLCARAPMEELGGTSHTLNKRLDSMLSGLKRAGLEEEHRGRLKKNLRKVKRASGFEEAKPKGYTMQDWGATAKAADAICSKPEAYTFNPRHNTKFTERSSKMNRAAIWITVMGALRINETVSIKLDEIDENGFHYYVKKSRSYPEKKYQPMPPVCWQHVLSYLKVRGENRQRKDDDRLFPISADLITKMAKATMLEAGLIPHNERLGLHGFRHLFATHSLENDYASLEDRQHFMNHKSPETLSHYTRDSAKQAANDRASAPFQDALLEEYGCTFEWDQTLGEGYDDAMWLREVPKVSRSALGPGRVVWDKQVLHLGKPVCYHNKCVMMPLLDENGKQVQFGIVEFQCPNALVGEPVRLIVNRRSLEMGPPGFEPESKSRLEAFFDGYRAALDDMGRAP